MLALARLQRKMRLVESPYRTPQTDKGRVYKIGDPKKLIGQVINLRSPLYCVIPKICRTCYGDLLDRNKTKYVGILAGQIFGERGTQLIMKCASGLVSYNQQLWAFEDLWNHFNVPIEIVDGKPTKRLDDVVVDCKDGKTNALTIQRHMPVDDMLFISTKSGHNLIVQKNHPLWIKSKPIHEKFPNNVCRLIGDNEYTEIQSTRKTFTCEDHEMNEIAASDVKQYDAI